MSSFNRSLQALGSSQISTNGRWVVMPAPAPSKRPSRKAAVERRRRLFSVLVWLCIGTLLLGLLPGLRWLLWAHLAADMVLAGMVAMLLCLRSMSDAPVDRSSGRLGSMEEVPYATRPPGRFEPAGHGYRMVGEALENPLVSPRLQSEPPSITVFRPEDPPSVVSRPQSLRAGGLQDPEEASSITVVRSSGGTARRPKMFLDDEEDLLQAQGL